MAAVHHTSFQVSSINGKLHVTWTNDDNSTTTETIDPQRSFQSDDELVAYLNEYAKAYNDGKDQEYGAAHPTIDPSVQNIVGQTFQVS